MATFTRSDDLEAAEFIDANLRGARFVGADLTGVVMRGVDIARGDIDAPWLPDGDSFLRVNGVDVIPFVYGHTNLADTPTMPVASMNFGQQTFHYDMPSLRSELILQGADVSKFVPGVGTP